MASTKYIKFMDRSMNQNGERNCGEQVVLVAVMSKNNELKSITFIISKI